MVKINGNTVHLDVPAKEMRVFVHGYEVNISGITVDKLNRVYIALEVEKIERT